MARFLRVQTPRPLSGGAGFAAASTSVEGQLVNSGSTVSGASPQQVTPVVWRGLDSPARWQEIGKYGVSSPLVNQVGMAPQLQRKSGFLGSSPRRLYPATGLPSWQQTQQVGNYQGTQRFGKVPPTQGPSRFGVSKMRSAITAQQVQQSGAGLLPFVQSMYANQQS